MNNEIGLLSDEMLDLCSSFDSTAEFDASYQKKYQVSQDISESGDRALNSLEESLDLRKNGISDVTNFQSENDTYNSVGTLEGLSLDYGRSPSIMKIKELKQAIVEANEACSLWMTGQLMLGCYKMCERQVRPDLAARVRQVTAASKLKQLTQIKSRNGEVFNILGLEEGDIEAETNKWLSTAEINELKDHAVTLLRAKIEHLSAQRRKLKGVLGAHCHKVTAADSVLCKERDRLVGLHQQVRQRLEQAGQLLMDSNRAMQQLAQVVQRATQDLKDVSYTSLRDKARCLHNTTSLYMHKIEQEAYKDQNHTKAINTLGDNLKISLITASEQLKSLQKTLEEYQRKEEASNRFKEIVSEFVKTKRHLQHKYQTLNVLNDPDVSFS